MKTDSNDIDKERLLQIITTEYGVPITSIRFVPKGEEAFAYIGQTPSGERCFIRVQPTVSAPNLEQVYPVVYALHHVQGLSHVVAPYKTRIHTYSVALQGYTVALFPYIDGQTLYQQVLSEADIRQAATLLAYVHQSPCDQPSLAQEHFDNPFKAPILRELDAAQTASPAQTALQHEVGRLLLAERAEILATLERMEQLPTQMCVSDWVLTHGDPNDSNMLKDQFGRLHLTDWGSLGIGPIERDLMHWTGETFEVFLEEYARLRPDLSLHRVMFEFYFYRWCVQEIADFATRILFGQLGPIEDEHAWIELQEYLPIRHTTIAQEVQAVQKAINRVLG